MYPTKITRTMLLFGKFRMRFHVKLDDMHREYDFNDKVYTAITPTTFITIENTDNTNSSILITEKNIFSVITAVNKVINNLSTNEIYATQGGDLIIYKDEVQKNTVQTSMSLGGVMVLQPSIVYDTNDVSYEGVTLYINTKDNYVQLTIEQLEALRYILTKVDFFTYSQSLVNYCISYYNINKDASSPSNQLKQNNTSRYKPNIIDWGVKTTATFSRNDDDSVLNPPK